MAERPRDESAILRGWATLRLNFMLQGYVSRQYLWTVRWAEWLYYNFAAGNFTQRNFVANLIRLKLNYFYLKKQKTAFEPPFGVFRKGGSF